MDGDEGLAWHGCEHGDPAPLPLVLLLLLLLLLRGQLPFHGLPRDLLIITAATASTGKDGRRWEVFPPVNQLVKFSQSVDQSIRR